MSSNTDTSSSYDPIESAEERENWKIQVKSDNSRRAN